MRDIKFRAWDGEKMRLAFDLSSNPKYWWDSNKDFPLMQFTGLYDANGVEIYEGDVLGKTRKPELTRIVVFHAEFGAFRMEFTDGDLRANDGSQQLTQEWLNKTHFCVVGNIHDGGKNDE